MQSPYGYPSINSPHPGNGQNHQQYTPLQSPYLPSGIPPGPPVGMPPRPGFPYARSDMPEPIHHGHSRIPYEYPPPLVQQHPQHAPHMPLHQRSHTSPAHVAPPGFAYEYAYGSPPMSPNAQTRAMNHQQQMRGGPSGGRGRHARHGSFADEQPSGMYQPAYPRHGGPQGQGQAYQRPTGGSFGMANTPAMSNAPSNWTSPGMQSSAFNTPHQPSSSVVERAPSDWSEATSPVIPHAPAMPTNWRNRQNRMSWSGQAKDGDDGEKERKAYHPQAPAKRSDWVMWVGNV